MPSIGERKPPELVSSRLEMSTGSPRKLRKARKSGERELGGVRKRASSVGESKEESSQKRMPILNVLVCLQRS